MRAPDLPTQARRSKVYHLSYTLSLHVNWLRSLRRKTGSSWFAMVGPTRNPPPVMQRETSPADGRAGTGLEPLVLDHV